MYVIIKIYTLQRSEGPYELIRLEEGMGGGGELHGRKKFSYGETIFLYVSEVADHFGILEF